MSVKMFKCKHCGNEKEMGFWKRLWSPHLFGKYQYTKCTSCGKRSWHKKVKVQEVAHSEMSDRVKIVD